MFDISQNSEPYSTCNLHINDCCALRVSRPNINCHPLVLYKIPIRFKIRLSLSSFPNYSSSDEFQADFSYLLFFRCICQFLSKRFCQLNLPLLCKVTVAGNIQNCYQHRLQNEVVQNTNYICTKIGFIDHSRIQYKHYLEFLQKCFSYQMDSTLKGNITAPNYQIT